MSRIDMEDFSKDEKEITRIFIASNLKEAQGIEETLTGHGIDYAVKIEKYVRLGLFASEMPGVAFYVSSGQGSFCRDLLRSQDFLSGIVEEDL
jgi:hypothetical protein